MRDDAYPSFNRITFCGKIESMALVEYVMSGCTLNKFDFTCV